MKRSKVEKITEHFGLRCQERLGTNINRAIKRELIGKIQSNKSEVVESTSLNRKVHLIKLDDRLKQEIGCDWLVVVYDKARHKLVTVLNPFYSEIEESGIQIL